jgi:hypothetical protein
MGTTLGLERRGGFRGGGGVGAAKRDGGEGC